MGLILHNKSQKKKIAEKHAIQKGTFKINKKKSKRLMPLKNDQKSQKKFLLALTSSTYDTKHNIQSGGEKDSDEDSDKDSDENIIEDSSYSSENEYDSEDTNGIDQTGGAFFLKRKLKSDLKYFINIYKKIKKTTKKLSPFVSEYTLQGKLLEEQLKKRIENVNYLMVRYQHLISYQKQQFYIEKMREKNPPKPGSVDYYQSQLDKIKVQETLVKNYMKELEKRKETTDKTIAGIRKEVEQSKLILDKKYLKKFDAAVKAYIDNTPRMEEVSVKLKEHEIYENETDKSLINKKKRNIAKTYFIVFKNFKEQKADYDAIMEDAKKTNEALKNYYSLVTKHQANYEQVNDDYKTQMENYNKIIPILDDIFGKRLPSVMSRKLEELAKSSEKMNDIIHEFSMTGDAIDSNMVPWLEGCKQQITHVENIQKSIIFEVGKICTEMFKLKPNAGNLSKKIEDLVRATNDGKHFLTNVSHMMSKLFTIIKNTQTGGSIQQYGGGKDYNNNNNKSAGDNAQDYNWFDYDGYIKQKAKEPTTGDDYVKYLAYYAGRNFDREDYESYKLDDKISDDMSNIFMSISSEKDTTKYDFLITKYIDNSYKDMDEFSSYLLKLVNDLTDKNHKLDRKYMKLFNISSRMIYNMIPKFRDCRYNSSSFKYLTSLLGYHSQVIEKIQKLKSMEQLLRKASIDASEKATFTQFIADSEDLIQKINTLLDELDNFFVKSDYYDEFENNVYRSLKNDKYADWFNHMLNILSHNFVVNVEDQNRNSFARLIQILISLSSQLIGIDPDYKPPPPPPSPSPSPSPSTSPTVPPPPSPVVPPLLSQVVPPPTQPTAQPFTSPKTPPPSQNTPDAFTSSKSPEELCIKPTNFQNGLSDKERAILRLLIEIQEKIDIYLKILPTECEKEKKSFFSRLFRPKSSQHGGLYNKTQKKIIKNQSTKLENKRSKHLKLNHYKKLPHLSMKVGGSPDSDNIITSIEEIRDKILDLYRLIYNLDQDKVNFLVISYSYIVDIHKKVLYNGSNNPDKKNIQKYLEDLKKNLEEIFDRFNLTPATNIVDTGFSKTRGQKSNNTSTDAIRQYGNTTKNFSPTGDYVAIFVPSEFNDILSRILSSNGSVPGQQLRGFVAIPNQPPEGLQQGQPQGIVINPNGYVANPSQNISGQTLLVQPNGPPSLSDTTTKPGVNPIQSEIFRNIKEIADKTIKQILPAFESAKKELTTQVDDFKHLRALFVKMDSIQKSISEISAKISIPESERADAYIAAIPEVKEPTPPLEQVLNSAESIKMRDYLKTIVVKLSPDKFSLLAEKTTPSNAVTTSTEQTIRSNPYIIDYDKSTTSTTTGSINTLAPTPTLAQGTVATPGIGPNGLPVSGPAGLPGATGIITLPGFKIKFEKFNGKKLDPKIPEDLVLLNIENELRKAMEAGPGNQNEVNNILSTKRNFLTDHPLAFYYLSHPMGLEWLMESEKGKNFIATPQGLNLIPNISNLIKNPLISGQYGDRNTAKLLKLYTEGKTQADRESVLTEVGKARVVQEVALAKAINDK